MQKDLKQLVVEYIQSNKVMELATERDGQPWVSTVNYVSDSGLNLYWLSLRSRRHSLELKGNGRVAAGITQDPHVKRCLHVEGDATEVKPQDIEKIHQLYCSTYGDKPERLADAKSADPNRRTYYVLKPRLFVLYDEVNFPDNPRQELKL